MSAEPPPPPLQLLSLAAAEKKTSTDSTDDETSIVKDAHFAASIVNDTELEFGEERTGFEDATDAASVKGEDNATTTNSPDQEISELKEKIKGYEDDLANATDKEEKRELRRLITARTNTLNLLLRQSPRDGEPFHCSTDDLDLYCSLYSELFLILADVPDDVLLFLIRAVWTGPSSKNVCKLLEAIFLFPIIDLPGQYPYFFLVLYFFVLAGLVVSIVYAPVSIKWLLSVCSLYFTFGTSTALTIINSKRQGAN
jgi:hypothetical protein